eukprot:356098-Chlamydomonas_euryale.AAC.4
MRAACCGARERSSARPIAANGLRRAGGTQLGLCGERPPPPSKYETSLSCRPAGLVASPGRGTPAYARRPRLIDPSIPQAAPPRAERPTRRRDERCSTVGAVLATITGSVGSSPARAKQVAGAAQPRQGKAGGRCSLAPGARLSRRSPAQLGQNKRQAQPSARRQTRQGQPSPRARRQALPSPARAE